MPASAVRRDLSSPSLLVDARWVTRRMLVADESGGRGGLRQRYPGNGVRDQDCGGRLGGRADGGERGSNGGQGGREHGGKRKIYGQCLVFLMNAEAGSRLNATKAGKRDHKSETCGSRYTPA